MLPEALERQKGWLNLAEVNRELTLSTAWTIHLADQSLNREDREVKPPVVAGIALRQPLYSRVGATHYGKSVVVAQHNGMNLPAMKLVSVQKKKATDYNQSESRLPIRIEILASEDLSFKVLKVRAGDRKNGRARRPGETRRDRISQANEGGIHLVLLKVARFVCR